MLLTDRVPQWGVVKVVKRCPYITTCVTRSRKRSVHSMLISRRGGPILISPILRQQWRSIHPLLQWPENRNPYILFGMYTSLSSINDTPPAMENRQASCQLAIFWGQNGWKSCHDLHYFEVSEIVVPTLSEVNKGKRVAIFIFRWHVCLQISI